VQALEKGLEILVTKAHLSKGGTPVDSIEDIDETIDITINEKAKQMLDDKKEPSEGSENAGLTEDDSSLWMTAHFNNLEDVIQLSHYINISYESKLITVLYYYDGNIICILNCLLNCLSTKRIYSVKYLNTARN